MTDPIPETPQDEDVMRLRPTAVAQAGNPWVVPIGVGVVVLAGVVVFAGLNAGRQAKAPKQTAIAPAGATLEAAPPPLEPLPVANTQPSQGMAGAIPAPHMAGMSESDRPPSASAVPAPQATQGAPANSLDQRRKAPAMIVDLSAPLANGPGAATPAVAAAAVAGAGAAGGVVGLDGGADGKDTDLSFARRVGAEAVATAQSSRIAQPSRTAPQGTVIPAVLETAINSDLPGFARAVVSRDVRAFDGATVVIPRGAKLIGQYRNAVAAGQSRAFIVWTRLIRPDGVTIDIGSPAADALGRGGLEGKTDRHFLQRFGASILLSVVNAGVAAASNGGSGGNQVIIGSAQDANRIAEIALQKQIDIPPTIKVAQGTPIRVFVARDLVFEAAAR